MDVADGLKNGMKRAFSFFFCVLSTVLSCVIGVLKIICEATAGRNKISYAPTILGRLGIMSLNPTN